ncbi:MAG: HlyD family efflux transporter periplasmic adaptor subunit [Planctomycetota bacterium]|jgi:multidrug resistance efflux pump
MSSEDNVGAAYEMRRQARGTTPPPKGRPWLRRRITAGIALAGCIVLVIIVYAWRSYTRAWAVEARVNKDVLKISPKVNGQMAELFVEETEEVAKAHVLARLEDGQVRAALDAAKANRASKQSEHAHATASLKMIEAEAPAAIERAQAVVEVARARVAQARAALELRRAQMAQEVCRAEARWRESQAGLRRLKKGPREEVIKAAEARLAASEARLALAMLEVQQSEELVVEGIDSQYILEVRKTNMATQQSAVREAELELQRMRAGPTEEEVEGAEQAVAAWKAELEMVRAGEKELDRLEAEVAMREAELKVAGAQLKQAEAQQAQVELARQREESARAALVEAEERVKELSGALADRLLKSPVTGTVTRVYVHVGEFCTTQDVAMLVETAGRKPWVDAFVSQKEAHLVEVGQRAKVKLPGPWRLLWWRRYKDAVVTATAFHTRSIDAGGDFSSEEGSPRVRTDSVWVKLRFQEPLDVEPVRGMTARAYVRVR